MPDHSESNEDLRMYKSIFQTSLDAILLTKPDGSILAANPAAEKMFGMTQLEIIAAGQDALLVQDQALKSAIRERTQKGSVKAVLNFKRNDGLLFSGEVTSTLFKDEDGILKTNMIIRDITDYELGEKALQECENHFCSVLKNSQDVIYRFNLQEGCYEYMSPAIRSLGFEPEELMAMSNEEVLSRVHPEDLPSLLSVLSHINEKGRGLCEYRFQGNNGHYRWWSNKMVIVKDPEGKPLYRDGFVRDVTESKQAEEMLRQSEKKFSKVFNANPAAMTLSDAEGRWIDVSERFVKLTGYSREELIGHTSAELNLIDTEKRKQYKNELQEKGSKRDLEFEIQTKSGEKRIVLSSSETIELDGEIMFISFIYDVSEREKDGLELRRLNNQLNIASRAAGAGIWDWNLKTGQLEWSSLMFDLLGLDPEKNEASFETWENTLHAEDLEEASRNIEHAIDNHTFLDNEYRIVRPDGQVRWINALGQAEYDDQGIPLRMTGICIDITQRKQVEDDLQESEEELTKVLDAVPAAVWIAHDPEGLHITGNNISYELLRLPQGVEASKSAPESERPSTFKMFKDGIEMVTEEMPVQLSASGKELTDYEFDLVFSDGSIRNMLGNSKPLYDNQGNPRGSISAFIDITKRKQAEIKLKETLENLEDLVKERTSELLLANEYNRNLIETSLDPLVTIGPDGKITDVNRATEKVTGYSRGKLVGTDFADYFTNPGDAKKGYQQVFRSGMVRDYPLEIKHKDGSLTPVLYNASVYMDALGEVVGVFAAARDITERVKAENELREYWENLEQQVKLRTQELAKSNADLKQFAYVASHDLREPLRMINSFLQLLERRYKSQLDDDAREFIGFAVDGAKRLDKMIMDLLEYSRITNKEMMFSEVDFEKVIHQIKLNLKVRIHENNAKITCDQLPKNVRADMNQMILLFQNLIINAIKYRSDEKPKIHISSHKEDDHYAFSVMDNGIGIDPKHLERIFTIFQRLHTHQEYEGSGIGLSIAQRIVHQHGGEIWAESEPGKGTTFQFTIKN